MKNLFSFNSFLLLCMMGLLIISFPSHARETRDSVSNQKSGKVLRHSNSDLSTALKQIQLSAFKIAASKKQAQTQMLDIENQMGKLVEHAEQLNEAQIRDLFSALSQVTDFDASNSVGQVLEIFVKSKKSRLVRKIISEVDTEGTLQDALSRVESGGNS